MIYDFDEIIERRGSFSLKWDYEFFLKKHHIAERFDEETIPLFSADMDFRCPSPVADAIRKLAERNIYGYTAVFPSGIGLTYYTPLINWFKERMRWTVEPEDIVFVNGTVEAIEYAIRAFTRPGDGIMINRPVYRPFTQVIEDNGRVVVNNQLTNKSGYYTLDFDDFEAKASLESTKLFILCHPHNPTGRVWNVEELTRIGDICKTNSVVIVSDEIHGDLLRKGTTFRPIASVVDPTGIVTCTSPSKTFNLAGLQAANIVIQDSGLRAQFFKSSGLILPNPFAVAAVIAAYSEGGEWLAQLKDYLDGNIDWALEFLKTRLPKVKCCRPEGTYMLWMDFRALGLPAHELRRRIYVDANVVLESGVHFDPDNGSGFERLSVPTRRALLKEALERIARQFECR